MQRSKRRYGAIAEATYQDWGLPYRMGRHVHIKKVHCNKGQCTKCPHGYYAYWRWTVDGKKAELYLGRCDAKGYPERNTQLAV